MRLWIPLHIWQKMRAYVQLTTPNEITGVGIIGLVKEELLVDEIYIPKQRVSPGYCESTLHGINDLIYDVMEERPERVGDLRFRWHSHAESAVFWSTVDEMDIYSSNSPWVVNLVMNARDDYIARLDIFEGLRLHNIPLDVRILYPPVDEEILTACQQEVEQRVSFIDRRSARKDHPATVTLEKEV